MLNNHNYPMTKERPYISVILPVYGVERFIDNCIKSLQAQTLKNLEFIFVDDCGPDNSIDKINEYAQKDNRIKIVHNEHNMGAGATRNHGIEVATGEFISFVDPDDWMNPEFYEILYNNAISGGFDVVKGRRIDVIKRANGEIRYMDNKQNESALICASLGYPLYAGFIHGHQSAIYRLDMVRKYNAHYSNTSFGECGMFILMACCHTNKYCFVSEAKYYYLQHEDSSAHILSKEKYESELNAIFEQIEYAKSEMKGDKGVPIYIKAKVNFLFWRFKELKRNPSLKGYLSEYVKAIEKELEKLGEEKEKKSFSLKTRLPHRIYTFVSRAKGAVHRKLTNKKTELENTQFDNREIAYLQNYKGAVFFTKRFLESDRDFAMHFLKDFEIGSNKYNNILKTDSNLYQEHLEYAKNDEICWKYIRRLGHISKTTIFLDREHRLCMKGDIIDPKGTIETRNLILLPQPTRKIIPGDTLYHYLLALGNNRKEAFGELCQFLDFVFKKFAIPNSDLIQGIAFDACPRNCILKEGHEYELYDFEYEYKKPLERGFFIYLASQQVDPSIKEWVYYRLCEHYGVVANQTYWHTIIQQGWIEIMDNTTDSKYFIK